MPTIPNAPRLGGSSTTMDGRPDVKDAPPGAQHPAAEDIHRAIQRKESQLLADHYAKDLAALEKQLATLQHRRDLLIALIAIHRESAK